MERQQYQGRFAIYFVTVSSPGALLNPLRGFLRIPNCSRHIFTLFEWCVLPACSHLASWPWRDAQQQSYALQQDALLEVFWSRDRIWNCASILKQLTVRVQSSYQEYRRQESSLIFIHFLCDEYISLCTFLCPQGAHGLQATSVPWRAYWARFLAKHHVLQKVNYGPSRSVYSYSKMWFKVLFTRTSRNRNLRSFSCFLLTLSTDRELPTRAHRVTQHVAYLFFIRKNQLILFIVGKAEHWEN